MGWPNRKPSLQNTVSHSNGVAAKWVLPKSQALYPI